MSTPASTFTSSSAGTHVAATLLASAEVWDMTLPWTPRYWDIQTLTRYRAAGFTYVSATVQNWPPTFEGTRDCIERFRALAVPHDSWLTFASSLHDIDRGRAEGKLVVGFNSQEASLLESDLSRVEGLYQLGVRHMLLAYNVRNLIADGCAEPANAGLSLLGRRVVEEMNRVGMVVDCSHTGCRSSLEAIELSSAPPIFSHSNPYAICPHIRNVTDEQIRACASRGGVVGVVGIGAFLGDPLASTESMFRHIDHIATLVGPEHVGLGTDFVNNMPALWETLARQKDSAWIDPTGTQLYEGDCFQPEQLKALVQLMIERGYSTGNVLDVLGGNFRRVYTIAARARAERQEKQ